MVSPPIAVYRLLMMVDEGVSLGEVIVLEGVVLLRIRSYCLPLEFRLDTSSTKSRMKMEERG